MKKIRQINRRDFSKFALFGPSGLRLFAAGSARPATHMEGIDSLYSSFQTPPSRYRPFFRWWWNGNRVTAEEIRRELDLMAEAGIGGVEINPIALHETVEDPTGIPVDWLSDEWTYLLRLATDEAKARGMLSDLIVGTGWPFGGQFLEEDEIIQGIETESQSLQGPGIQQIRLSELARNPDNILQIRLSPQPLERFDQVRDLTSEVKKNEEFSLELEEGKYQLQVLSLRRRFREVMFGAPGGDGPVLDHFNQPAVQKYLNRMSDRLQKRFGSDWSSEIRSLFCDSIELEGANWTSDFNSEFRRRRGYDISIYLPLLLEQKLEATERFREDLNRIRYDYSLVLAELFQERFIIPFHQWCQKRGVKSRYQAYGYPWIYTDLLEGYRIPDIPEGDQWLFNSGWVKAAEIDQIRYSIWNKYASSAGHLENRTVISSEAMTNTRGVFEASLEYVKQATDLNFIGGINHLVLHGFNYSPPEAGIPGWIRFGTYFSEHNPWWPYLHLWSDYAARLSLIFQETKADTQIAIMGPTLDVWSRSGLDRNPWNTTPWYLHAIWQALNNHGYLTDYINGDVLNQSQFRDGKIAYKEVSFEALVLVETETIEPRTARSLLRFVQSGGRLIFVGKRPSRSPGWANRTVRDRLVQSTMERIDTQFRSQIIDLAPPEKDQQFEWARAFLSRTRIPPTLRISNPDSKLFFLKHGYRDEEILFFANADREKVQRFRVQDYSSANFQVWDPETGHRNIFGQKGDPLEIVLNPLESLLLIGEKTSLRTLPGPPAIRSPGPSRLIEGPWKVELYPIQGPTFFMSLDKLIDFARHSDLRSFSGRAIYRTTFEANRGEELRLDLGEVREIAEVHLNGIFQGVRWWGKRELDLEQVQEGTNYLEIQVTTLSFNYFRTKREDPSIGYWLKRSRTKEPLPAGLIGPVQLTRLL